MVESLLSMETTRLVSTGRCTQRRGHPRKGTPKDGGTQGRVHPEAGTPKKGCTQRRGLIHNRENTDPSTELLPELVFGLIRNMVKYYESTDDIWYFR